jgi:Spy/CpxP family protein refolding chaperone
MTLGFLSAAALAFSIASAPAADSSAYMAQCKEGANSGQLPPNVKSEDMIDMCECMVDQVGDNQAALDEMVDVGEQMSNATTPEQRQQIAQSAPPNETIRKAFQACAPANMGPPPQQ